MLLYIDENRKIKSYSTNDNSSKTVKGYVEFYNGEFNFFMGDYIDGKEKVFYLNEDGTIRIEYVDIKLQEEPLSEQEQIAIDTALNVEYIACLMEASLT